MQKPPGPQSVSMWHSALTQLFGAEPAAG
jgi:hypothetical protein